MKKTAIIFSILIFFTGCTLGPKDQFQGPEYYLKAKVIEVQSQKKMATADVVKMNYFGLTSVIASKWFDRETLKNDSIAFMAQDELRFLVSFDQQTVTACRAPHENEKDFCNAFKSPQDYYEKIWMLTPDDLKSPQYATRGDHLIILQKRMWFAEPKVKAVYKYQGNHFVAYRRDFDADKRLKSELVIFHQKNSPNAVVIASLVDRNDELFQEILETIE